MAVTTTYSLSTTVGEFTGNTFTNGNEFGSTVVSNGGDGFLLSYGWSAGGDVGPLVDFYADGTATPSRAYLIPYGVPNADVDMIGDPAMIRLSDGNYAVVWDSATQGGGNIRGAILDASGTIIAADFQVSLFATDTDPELTALADGNWVAVFRDGDNVFTQLMSATGAKIGGQVTFSSGANDDYDPVITGLSDGGYALAWTEDNGIFTGDSIWIAIRNADGTQRVAPTEIGFGVLNNNNTQPAIAVLQNGNIALVYKDSGWSGDGITLQLINPNTGANLSLTRVDVDEAKIEQDPDITVLSNGMIVVTWTHPFGAGDDDIRGRLFTETGTPLQIGGNDTFTLTGAGGNQTSSSIAALLEARFVTSWTTDAISGSSVQVEVNQLNEVLTSDATGDVMTGTALASVLNGNGGDDTMLGGGGQDSLFGGDGNDTITSDGDSGLYQGDAGDDRMESAGGGETMVGGTGIDTIDHRWFGNDYNFDMTTGLTNFSTESYTEFEIALMGDGNDSIGGTSGADTIFGGGGKDFAEGGGGNDVLNGGARRDRLFGDGGDDQVDGGGGTDRLEGGGGNDALSGGGGKDKLLGDGGDDTILGGGGRDNMDGGAGNDLLFGNAGRDRLTGGFGADTFRGGSGADTLDGGGGADVFVFGQASGRDRVLNFENGIDRVDLDGVAFGDLSLSSIAGGVRVTLDAGDQIILLGVGIDQINSGDFI